MSSVVPSSGVVLQLTPGSTVEGVVVSAQDSKPVADVEVRAVPAGSWNSPFHRSGVSLAEGAFSIQGLEPGAYMLVAEGKGWRGQLEAPLQVGLAKHLDHARVMVSHAAVVSGMVRIQSGSEPCRQGSVTLGPSPRGIVSPYDPPTAPQEETPPNVPAMVARIEPDGAVHFNAVPPGKYHVTIQCVDHTLKAGPTTLDVSYADMDGFVWSVERGLRLVLHFVDEANQPLPNARARVVFPGRTGLPGPTLPVRGEADGHYEYPASLYPGTYTVLGDGGYEGEPVSVELREGAGRVDATLRLLGAGTIFVAVRTSEGNPVDDVTVSAVAMSTSHASKNAAGSQESVSTSSPAADPAGIRTIGGISLGSGMFRVGPLASGHYEVTVSDGINPPVNPTGSAKGVLEVASGRAVRTEVVLDHSGWIRGRVLDQAQQPMPDVWVSADCQPDATGESKLRTIPSFLRQSARVMSDPEGRFAIDGLARDAVCTVRGEEPDGAVALKREAHPGDNVVISLPAMGALAGMAVTADGQPVEQFMVSVKNEQTGGMRNEAISAPRGRWTLGNLQPGTLQIRAQAGRVFARLQTELTPGGTLRDLQLEFAPSPAAPPN
jgi:hypothetical protein